MKRLALLFVCALACVGAGLSAAQSQSASAEPAAQPVSGAAFARFSEGKCRVQCPAQPGAPSRVECRPISAQQCGALARELSQCRVDALPFDWCAERQVEEN